MMTYNFDQLNDRRNSYSMKWDIKDGSSGYRRHPETGKTGDFRIYDHSG